MALSRIDTTNMIEDVPQSKLDNNINFRNIIINGDMSIAQRGTSATGLGNGDNGYHTCDRWKFFESGAPTYEFTQTQDTDVPTGQGFATSLKMDCTTADASLDTADLLRIMQVFEGQNLQYLKYGTANASSLTASFWVKSNVTGDYNTHLYASGATNRIISSTFTINSADTWEKKTITFAGDTAQVIPNDSTGRLLLTITLLSGTDYTSTDSTSWGTYSGGKLAYGQVANVASSTANNFWITGVQLEAGTTASDFEFLPRGIMENLCFRYYQDYSDYNIYVMGKAYGASTSGLRQPYSLKTTMRASPTTVVSNTSNGGSSTNFAINTTSPKWVSFNLTSSNGSNVNMYQRFKFTADAEL
jgi:hypothetical protein